MPGDQLNPPGAVGGPPVVVFFPGTVTWPGLGTHCPEGSARAVWFQWVNGAAVVGCWRDGGVGYVVEFEDNDQREFEKQEQETLTPDRAV